MQTQSLSNAVKDQVLEFINSGQSFSKYDITKALRQKCNDNLLEIPECLNPDSTNQFLYLIQKKDVDQIFEQLIANCSLNGLPELETDFQRAPNGVPYRVFFVNQSASQVPTGNVYASAPTLGATATKVSASAITNPEIIRRINLFMTRCTQRGIVPTLKQIQSAIKRKKSTGLSYGEISQVAKSLGFNV